MPTAEMAPLSVPRDLLLDPQVCTQDGKFSLSLSITWTSRALKQVPGLLGRWGEELYLGGGLRGTQGTPLHIGSSGESYSRTESSGKKGSCLHLNCSASGPTPGRSWRAGAGLAGQLGEAAGGGEGRREGGKRGRGFMLNLRERDWGRPSQFAAPRRFAWVCVCVGGRWPKDGSHQSGLPAPPLCSSALLVQRDFPSEKNMAGGRRKILQREGSTSLLP